MAQERMTLPPGFDAQRVLAHIAEGRAQADALNEALPTLLAEHEGEWVAAYNGEFVFAASLQDVVAQARDNGWPVDVVPVVRLRRSGPALLL